MPREEDVVPYVENVFERAKFAELLWLAGGEHTDASILSVSAFGDLAVARTAWSRVHLRGSSIPWTVDDVGGRVFDDVVTGVTEQLR